jgi:hypothetical protein
MSSSKVEQYPRPASVPTLAPPGTEEKIHVMAARAEAGEQIFHPNDATGLAERPGEKPVKWEWLQQRAPG